MSNVKLRNSRTSLSIFLFCLLPLLFSSACVSKASHPNLPRSFPGQSSLTPKNKNPVILIPGVLGSALVNRRTGEKVWPGLFVSDSDPMALPITSANFADNTDDLIATEILETVKFGRLLPEISVYDSLLTALERYGGYRRGNADAPDSEGDHDTFYIFAYDWRRDNVESAKLLAQKIATLKQKLGKPDLRFDIVAHSMGGLVARYYAMYGGREVLNSAAPKPDWSGARHLNKLIMLGTPNAGSMDALRTLVLGYSITETNRLRISLLNKLNREVIFTSPSSYQLLPRNASARFIDARLAPLQLDLFDPETWRTHKWSAAFNVALEKSARRSLLKEQGAGRVADATRQLATERERFLRAALARAAAFHRALDATSTPPDSLRLYLFGGDCEATLDAALVITDKKTGELETLFQTARIIGNGEAQRKAFNAMFAPGDGRVTRRSLFGIKLEPDTETSQLRAMKQKPFQATFDCELHGDLPLNLRIQNNLLTMLLGNSY